ncbi:hypothetical protein CAL14_12595 [Bordetella genomosp. 9]|uniref:nuclear transport factor 2 family protein n=1 Tax=Bordetella genomosp. 9 TaxID=1416803 RepID=UPI000A296B44|nr:nuclear transport factor 2 family protein [Bordetella genomosp. 9]ARP91024.1 hypothetical protein CAL14_12595 [Bordetella genomosp. 9]
MTTDNIRLEVAECVEALRRQMLDPDGGSLAALTADALSYGHSNGTVEDKAAFIDALVSRRSDFRRIELSEQYIIVVGDVALARHLMDADTNDGGKPGHVSLRILLVWHRQADGWKLLARQAVRAPT